MKYKNLSILTKNYYFKKVIKTKIQDRKGIFFLSADQERNIILGAGDIFNNYDKIENTQKVLVKKNQNFVEKEIEKIEYISTSKTQMISLATSLIPFLEHNDANRALMGSNMQRQAIPLERKELCLIETGMEMQIAKESQSTLISRNSGIVKYTSPRKIIIREELKEIDQNINQSIIKKIINKIDYKVHPSQYSYTEKTYRLENRRKSNQNTYLQQVAAVEKNQRIRKEQVLADGASTLRGKLALGKNILIGYMGWEGYNFEDAIIISERLVKEDVLTSIHIKKYKTFLKNTGNGEVRI